MAAATPQVVLDDEAERSRLQGMQMGQLMKAADEVHISVESILDKGSVEEQKSGAIELILQSKKQLAVGEASDRVRLESTTLIDLWRECKMCFGYGEDDWYSVLDGDSREEQKEAIINLILQQRRKKPLPPVASYGAAPVSTYGLPPVSCLPPVSYARYSPEPVPYTPALAPVAPHSPGVGYMSTSPAPFSCTRPAPVAAYGRMNSFPPPVAPYSPGPFEMSTSPGPFDKSPFEMSTIPVPFDKNVDIQPPAAYPDKRAPVRRRRGLFYNGMTKGQVCMALSFAGAVAGIPLASSFLLGLYVGRRRYGS